MDPNAHLRNELLRDAEEFCQKLECSPDAVLISGDIAFAGDSAEYTYALAWLEELCHRCGTTTASVFTVPGNHDVNRSIAARPAIQALHRDIKAASDLTLEPTLRGLLCDAEGGRMLYEPLAQYNAFAGQFFCDLLPPERTIAKRDLILNDGSILRLSGANSAFVSSSADRPGDLFVDPACFQLQRERGVEHLVLCHHPCSWLRQGDQFSDTLNDISRIQLFGHEHTNRISLGRDTIRVSASAAHPDRTEPGWEPGYNLLEVWVEGEGNSRALKIKAHVRVWQQRPGGFRPKYDRGSDVFITSIDLDSWFPPTPSTATEPTQSPTAPAEAETEQGDSMKSLREITIQFFKLTLSQKSEIAGKMNLIEEEDANLPDFERFRRVLFRAKERGQLENLSSEIKRALEGR